MLFQSVEGLFEGFFPCEYPLDVKFTGYVGFFPGCLLQQNVSVSVSFFGTIIA